MPEITDLPEEYRTCPWYYDSADFVVSINDLRDDYEKGRLGEALELPAPLRVYIRAAIDAWRRWSDYWQDEIN